MDPDTFEDGTEDGELDGASPEADGAEQHTELGQGSFDPAAANVADMAEQARVVDLDEDDYR
ncbi:hypothetical protein [Nocardia crassostreae]|uniref:hypothetical protein n=1 Tax=Nocardia crassostreae TaxID=53428 RepID=UPI000832FCF0|nr:hypothetical protein [Nocardia crassostreae]